MSAVKEIDAPYTIATLTQPIDGSRGRIFSSGVYSLNGSRKRKRSEIAVSSDGEGIHIYNVQTPKVVTSYAVPPQASFTTAPCCTYRKASNDQPTRRCTYSSIVHSKTGKLDPQLICFDETSEPNTLGRVEKFTYDIPKGFPEIVLLEIIPSLGDDLSGNSSHNVLVVYKNGQIECLSADLQTRRWKSDPYELMHKERRKDVGQIEVLGASLTNAQALSKHLLKEREDLLAVLQGSNSKNSELLQATYTLGLVLRYHNNRTPTTVHLISLRPFSADLITLSSPEVRQLTSWPLPSEPTVSNTNLHSDAKSYNLQLDSGNLTHMLGSALITYDLKSAIARQTSRLDCPEGIFRSFLRLTGSLSLANSESICGLFDLNYGSLQARYSPNQPTSFKGEKKRARGSPGIDLSGLSFISFFTTLDLALGITATELVGFPLGSILPSKKGGSHVGLLADSIGKGIGAKPTPYSRTRFGGELHPNGLFAIENNHTSSPKWEQTINQLDELASNDDVHGFEAIFADAVGIERDTREFEIWKTNSASAGQLQNGTKPRNNVNGTKNSGASEYATDADREHQGDGPLPSWKFPTSFDAQERFLYRPVALHALSKLFSWAPDINGRAGSSERIGSISIDFYAPNVFQYLLMTECITRDSLHRTLSQGSHVAETRTVKEGDIISALVDMDPELRTLHYVLNSGAYLDIDEIAQAVKHIVRSLDTTRSLSQLASHLLPNGDAETVESDIDDALKSMSDAIDQAQISLDNNSILILTQCLQAALTTLHTFPKARILIALRNTLSHSELFFLMNLLRIQLRGGGWVSRYFVDTHDSDPTDADSSPTDSAILIIANLLSYVLDTIGTAGWLLAAQSKSPSSEDAPDDLIHGLRLDIAAAVEGIYEATFMKGLLTEFLRFGSRTEASRAFTDPKILKEREKPFPLATVGAEYGDAETRMLPLGLKVKELPERTKDQGGRQVTKSRREIGMEISKKVPKYSIERIDI